MSENLELRPREEVLRNMREFYLICRIIQLIRSRVIIGMAHELVTR